jgi:hypothetical protein
MGAWPSGAVSTTNVDQTSDAAGNARADIETAFTRINDMLTARESVDGVCGLDASGFVPSARIAGFGLLKANNLSDLALASAARTNLGITATGNSVVTAATAAAALSVLGGMPIAGGTFTGAPLYAANPTADDQLARKKYVDDSVTTSIATDFESTDQTLAFDTLLTIPHSLSQLPKQVWAVIRCTSAQLGYGVGEEYSVDHMQGTGAGQELIGLSADATNIYVVMATGNFYVQRKDAPIGDVSPITNGSWKLVVRARTT